jgi:hypothetical protein
LATIFGALTAAAQHSFIQGAKLAVDGRRTAAVELSG